MNRKIVRKQYLIYHRKTTNAYLEYGKVYFQQRLFFFQTSRNTHTHKHTHTHAYTHTHTQNKIYRYCKKKTTRISLFFKPINFYSKFSY